MPSQDVFPRRNLPPEAEQWGREVENRVKSAESALEIAAQSISGQNRNTASSLSVLGGQVSDLVGRESYFSANGQSQTWNDTTNVSNMAFGGSVTFTLAERRLVKLRSTVYVDAEISAPASSSATPLVLVRLTTVTPQEFGSFDDLFFELPITPYTRFLKNRTRLAAETYRTLEAGTYSFQSTITINMYNYSAGTWAGTLSASDPTYSVDVLQPM